MVIYFAALHLMKKPGIKMIMAGTTAWHRRDGRVTIIREEDGKVLKFITNDLERTAQEIADLYKSRWQVELFFKWIKQNLKIKRSTGENQGGDLILNQGHLEFAYA